MENLKFWGYMCRKYCLLYKSQTNKKDSDLSVFHKKPTLMSQLFEHLDPCFAKQSSIFDFLPLLGHIPQNLSYFRPKFLNLRLCKILNFRPFLQFSFFPIFEVLPFHFLSILPNLAPHFFLKPNQIPHPSYFQGHLQNQNFQYQPRF